MMREYMGVEVIHCGPTDSHGARWRVQDMRREYSRRFYSRQYGPEGVLEDVLRAAKEYLGEVILPEYEKYGWGVSTTPVGVVETEDGYIVLFV